jgi:hypothetical protein
MLYVVLRDFPWFFAVGFITFLLRVLFRNSIIIIIIITATTTII